MSIANAPSRSHGGLQSGHAPLGDLEGEGSRARTAISIESHAIWLQGAARPAERRSRDDPQGPRPQGDGHVFGLKDGRPWTVGYVALEFHKAAVDAGLAEFTFTTCVTRSRADCCSVAGWTSTP